MVDRPGRPRPRFPAVLELALALEIAERLDRVDAGFGFVSAACGADILFLEAMLAHGAEVHMVLPFAPADFHETSVDVVPGDWGVRFDRLLERAAQVTVAGERGTMASAVLFEYGNVLVDGLGLLRAPGRPRRRDRAAQGGLGGAL